MFYAASSAWRLKPTIDPNWSAASASARGAYGRSDSSSAPACESLDALTQIEMQSLVEATWRESGSTAVLVTHDVEEAVMLADRVIVLEGGQIGLEREINIARPRLRDSSAFATLAQDTPDYLLGRTCPRI